MGKESKEFTNQVKPGQVITPLEAVKEGIQAVAPGLSLSKMLKEMGAELKDQARMGSHQLATALLRGHDSYVMYQRGGKEAQSKEGQDVQQERQMERGL